jgi:hypothetical protein
LNKTITPPATASSIPAEWPLIVREIIQREGQAIQRGAGNSIEVKSLRTNLWHPLMLPGGSTVFATAQDRDDILRKIESKP